MVADGQGGGQGRDRRSVTLVTAGSGRTDVSYPAVTTMLSDVDNPE